MRPLPLAGLLLLAVPAAANGKDRCLTPTIFRGPVIRTRIGNRVAAVLGQTRGARSQPAAAPPDAVADVRLTTVIIFAHPATFVPAAMSGGDVLTNFLKAAARSGCRVGVARADATLLADGKATVFHFNREVSVPSADGSSAFVTVGEAITIVPQRQPDGAVHAEIRRTDTEAHPKHWRGPGPPPPTIPVFTKIRVLHSGDSLLLDSFPWQGGTTSYTFATIVTHRLR